MPSHGMCFKQQALSRCRSPNPLRPIADGTRSVPATLSASDAMGYVLSLAGVSTVIIGCQTPAEVEENVSIAREFTSFDPAKLRDLESRIRPIAATVASYKRVVW